MTSESTLSSGSDPLASSQATKEREKGLFEDRKVCMCGVCVRIVCLCAYTVHMCDGYKFLNVPHVRLYLHIVH